MENFMNPNEKTKKRVLTNYFTKVTDGRGASSEIVIQPVSELSSAQNTDRNQVIEPRNNDAALFVNCSLTDEQKHLILVNPWIPPTTYAFPIIEKNKKIKLKFQYKWLTTYNWLVYSELQEGAFCKFCLVFATTGGISQHKLGALTLTAFTNWKKAKEAFNDHSNYDYHKLSVAKAGGFLNIYSNKKPSIVNALDDDRVKIIKQNRERLIPIIECILLCGYQEIPLRGGNDFGTINFKSNFKI